MRKTWHAALDLAWASYCDNTVPIGAVITDSSGQIVATGRNGIHTPGHEAHAMSGSRLAHAEINALLRLPLGPTSRFDDFTIYTTTEPCLLCSGAITMVRVGTVHYAATDPVAGAAATISADSPYLRRRNTRVVGPVPGTIGAFSRLLTDAWSWTAQPGGLVQRVGEDSAPQVARVVASVAASGVLARVAVDGGTVDDAMAAVADQTEAIALLLATDDEQ